MIKRLYGIDPEKVRQYCIEHEFFTKGDSEEYSEMLSNCRLYCGKIAQLKSIAADIICCSEKSKLERAFGKQRPMEYLELMMGDIVRECEYSIFYSTEV